ncbi:unnamed protein product [Moneuplotes crassus]|uniref:Uncharacterized protein n=2 Tax=Euplotes crassus TaxID=5936 RepID=A0AAD1XCN5_EUPCR|nr:unnamed protein product [Moneuplotes crassus]
MDAFGNSEIDRFKMFSSTPVKDYNRSDENSNTDNCFADICLSDIEHESNSKSHQLNFLFKDSEKSNDEILNFLEENKSPKVQNNKEQIEIPKNSNEKEITEPKKVDTHVLRMKRKNSPRKCRTTNPSETACIKAISNALECQKFNSYAEFKVRQTLQGFILGLYKNNEYRPLSLQYLVDKVDEVRVYLKRRNKFYNLHFSIKKSVIGALHSMKLFKKIGKDLWQIDRKAIEFEENLINKQLKMEQTGIEATDVKKEKLEQEDQPSQLSSLIDQVYNNEDPEKQKRELVEKFETMYQRLGGPMNIDNPFEGVSPDDDISVLWKKLGNNQMLGILHSFILLRPIIKDAIEREEQGVIEKETENSNIESKLLNDMAMKVDFLSNMVNSVASRVNTTD